MNDVNDGSSPQDRCPIKHATPLYGEEFERDPSQIYAHLRRNYEKVAPVMLEPGVPGWLVVDYTTLVAISRDPVTWSHDSRLWKDWAEGHVPDSSGLLPMMMWRPNLLFADGEEHIRLRRAVSESLDRIDQQRLGRDIRALANGLIDRFSASGRADLVSDYARLLPLLVFNRLFGLGDQEGYRLMAALTGIWDGADAERANADFERYMGDLIALKRREPGSDIPSWLMEHRADLSDEELLHQLVIIIGAGNEPTCNLIGNAMRLLLTDREFGADLTSSRLPVEDAIDRVLWLDTPMANYPFVYPRADVQLGEVTVPAGAAVGFGLAAANQSIVEKYGDQLAVSGNRAHVSFGAGPHRCPAQDLAHQISAIGITAVINRLGGLRLTVPAEDLSWRSSLFARALETLPVEFTAHPPLEESEPVWQTTESSSPPTTMSTNKRPRSERAAGSSLWSSLVRLVRGR
ncbi:cytochrome P450 [Salinactinospora qingdaonensis]|uniref:Cytochrome P450 n=1 Tax=Salinactinospora qingdaonensis TaxID=702744 RepID=A0ABP7GHT6_9ACTN